jgi:hypothetical protein
MKRLVLGLVAGLALVAGGCAEDGDLTTMDGDRKEKIEPGDVEEGDVPVGKEITLTGDVTKVYDDRTFSLSDDGIDFEEDLVVVTKDALPFTADEDAEVKVTGTVKTFTVTEAEKEFDWDFDSDVETELETDIEYYLADAKIEVIDPTD